jgi:hypothetical protein
MWRNPPATGRTGMGHATASGTPPAPHPQPAPHLHRSGGPVSSRAGRSADRAETVQHRRLPRCVARDRRRKVPRTDWAPVLPVLECLAIGQAAGRLIEPHRPPDRSSRRTYAGHHLPVQASCPRVFPQTAAGSHRERRPSRFGERFCPVRVVCLRHPGVAQPFPRHNSQSQSFQVRRRRKGR